MSNNHQKIPPRFWVTSHITALMDTECMVMSFRRMLRGVSDGEVILTEELCNLMFGGLGRVLAIGFLRVFEGDATFKMVDKTQ